MKRNLTWILALIFSLAIPAALADWPRWLGPEGDGIVDEDLADRWPDAGPEVLWRADVAAGYATPVVADGLVYLFTTDGGQDRLTAFAVDTGQEQWQGQYDSGYRGDYRGTRATPTIVDGKIYTLGPGGELSCWSQSDGRRLWQQNVLTLTGSENISWGCSSSPLVHDGAVIVQGGRSGPVALAFDAETGDELWRSEATGPSSYSAIVTRTVDDQTQLVVFAGNAVIGMDTQGQTLWRQAHETRYEVNAATPICRDELIFVTSNYGTGAQMIRVAGGAAETLWRSRDLASKFQPAILDGDLLLVNASGTLRGVRWPDGDILWSATDGRLGLGEGGSFVRFDDKLIALTERGTLLLVGATADGAELISRVELANQRNVWSSPVACDGRLFVKTNDELICLDVSGD